MQILKQKNFKVSEKIFFTLYQYIPTELGTYNNKILWGELHFFYTKALPHSWGNLTKKRRHSLNTHEGTLQKKLYRCREAHINFKAVQHSPLSF